MRRATDWAVLGALLVAGLRGGLRAEEAVRWPVSLRVEATGMDRRAPLVCWTLPAGIEVPPLELTEIAGDFERAIPCQFDPVERKLWWRAEGLLPAGSARTYRVQPRADGEPGGTRVEAIDRAGVVEFRWNGRYLARYHKAHVTPPEGMNPRFGRSGHLHPVATLSGSVVTDEMPPDHAHQSGIFLAYTRTQFAGRPVDFWNLAAGQGRVRFARLLLASSGPLFAQVMVEHEHVALDPAAPPEQTGAEDGGTPVLRERWLIRAGQVDAESGFWCLDILSTIRCAGDEPLKLPQYHYGGMALRGARGWTPDQVQCLTSLGQGRLEGNHTRPRWGQMRGPVDGRVAGIVLMTHPDNFRFPEPLRIHPTMPYMVYTPSHPGDWEIVPGKPHVSRYRFVIHDGELPAEAIDEVWHDFAHPLVAQVVPPRP